MKYQKIEGELQNVVVYLFGVWRFGVEGFGGFRVEAFGVYGLELRGPVMRADCKYRNFALLSCLT